ncbi:hypothetical protein QBC38DRAFT_516188 [Podospora fimiseda]|uniref:Jacalin-type lectin domain-containing protein n=1 Tax=Podospora fimiseda TaxID=252190 RepID=A0AAN7BID9_9PEZI|nr:hypothetical protein QBC38DRAFT_516188 [Podospora fimiseda]
MRFHPLLFIATTALAAPWSGDIIQPNTPVGGNTGTAFSLVAEEGIILKTLRFWRDEEDTGRPFIRGLEVTFTDEKKGAAGKPTKTPKEFTFEPDEVITQMSMWGNGIGTKTGRIYFKTSKGREYLAGRDEPEAHQTEFPMDVGSGILVGFSGQSGEDIDHVAPVFLKTLKKERRLEELKLEEFDLTKEGLKLESLDEGEFQFPADGGKEHKATFGDTVEKTVSLGFESSLAETFSLGITIGGGVPEIVSAEFSAGWEITDTKTEKQEFSKKEGLTWNLEVELKGPEDACKCTASVFMGTLDLAYTAVLVIDTVEGGKFRIPTSGRMKQVSASKVVTSCKLLSSGEPLQSVKSLPAGDAAVAADLVTDAAALAAAPEAEAAPAKRGLMRFPRRWLQIGA